MEPMAIKRSLPSEAHGSSKIPKTGDAIEFPKEPILFSDDVAVGKYLYELHGRFIPFKTSGPGQLLITNELLTLLYEKRENDPHGKVECGIMVYPVPEFDDVVTEPVDRATESQEYWKKEIGSFISALKETGATVGYVVSPYWYKTLNWNSLFTISTLSSIKYDVYVYLSHDEEYVWHLDSESPRSRVKNAASASIQLNELKISENWIQPDGGKNTSVWVVDSELAYNHLEDDEANKLHQDYYEYSSDEIEFENSRIESLHEGNISGTYKHGTVICKIVSKASSNRTSIHFVKCNKIGRNKKHILQCLRYIAEESSKLNRRWNIVVMTLGAENFRASESDDFLLYAQHRALHKRGFLFCCSAGNVTSPEHAAQSAIPDHPLSFFTNCNHCTVIGSHAINESKIACLPSTFGSTGCCVADKGETKANFNQGVTTWALGDNVEIPKIMQQKSNQIVRGTSLSAAVVAGAATLIVPKLIPLIDRLKRDKTFYSTKFKTFLDNNSDSFVCPRHEIDRKLIFNVEFCLHTLGYENKQ